MQHVGLSVDNLYSKFFEILLKNKKVLGPYMKNINCLLATGSAGTKSWQREITYALMFANKTSYYLVPGAYGFSLNWTEIMSRKKK